MSAESSSAVRARSAALEAISWAAAEVCSVEAVTCSVAADADSAEPAISAAAVEMLPVCSETAPIASVMRRNSSADAWVLPDASSISSFRSAPILTTPSVSAWTCPISSEICAAARCESSASFLTSSATTANPRPCSPARAASMAAFSASRFVCSAMPEMVSTIWPISWEREARLPIRSLVSPAVSWTRSNASVLDCMAAMPSAASSAISPAAARVPSAASLASPLIRACRSAPDATSLTAWAISATARPASWEVAAISCDAAESIVAELEICSISFAVCARMAV